MINNKYRKHIEKCCDLINDAITINCDNEKAIKKLSKALYETDCISEIICGEINKIKGEQAQNELAEMLDNTTSSSASGSIDVIGNDWLYLRLETLLPSDKKPGQVKRVSNTITNLLDYFSGYTGYLPNYDRAFVVIVEHKSTEDKDKASYDHDNKGYRAIPNALKGRVFSDDNQFVMSLGLFTAHNENDPHCDIYVIPIEDIAEFATYYLNF